MDWREKEKTIQKVRFVRLHRFMPINEDGTAANPLRAYIARVIERERRERRLKHKEMLLLFRKNADHRLGLSTYYKTLHRKNNLTLSTVQILADGLGLSVAHLAQ
jgi:hypothetical protein